MSLSNLVNIKQITNNIDSNIANLVTVIINWFDIFDAEYKIVLLIIVNHRKT